MEIKRPMTDMDKPRPKKMYLSGAITGRDREAVERKFAQAEIEMLAEGDIPISPKRPAGGGYLRAAHGARPADAVRVRCDLDAARLEG